MTTDSDDSPNPVRQALVERLARSATSAFETTDVLLSDTVARQVMSRTRMVADGADQTWLESLVGEVTRQIVVEKAVLLESVFQRGMDVSVAAPVNADMPVTDEAFKTSQRRLAELCAIARNGLQPDEWYLFKRYYLADATWHELAEEFDICDSSGQPSEEAARLRLAGGIDQLRVRLAGDAPPGEALGDPAKAPPSPDDATDATANTLDATWQRETMLTWGLSERQRYLATRSLPWVTLTEVELHPPQLPLKEPLLVNVAASDEYLEWAEAAEFSGTFAAPVLVMLEHDYDSLPAPLWSYSNGTVSPNNWSRAEDLLACSRLLESESAAFSVELATIPADEETLMLPVSQLKFDSEVTADTREHLSECVTCRVAFNQFLENRLLVWRQNVAASASVTAAGATSVESAFGTIRMPGELTQPEWLAAVPSDVRPVWSLLTLVAGFVGLGPVRTILAELKQRNADRPEILLAVFARMVAELRRRAARPRPPGMALASYAADNEGGTPGSDPSTARGATGTRGLSADIFGSLIQFALSGLSSGLPGGRASAVGPPDAPDWHASTEPFLNELQQGVPAQADGWSFTVQLDSGAMELVLHTVKDAAGADVPVFQAEWQRDGKSEFREHSESGCLRLSLDDLIHLSLEQRAVLRIQRA